MSILTLDGNRQKDAVELIESAINCFKDGIYTKENYAALGCMKFHGIDRTLYDEVLKSVNKSNYEQLKSSFMEYATDCINKWRPKGI